MTNKKCSGCGVELQSENSKEKGYIKPEIIKNAKYCERCFKITHYNEKLIVPLKNINEHVINEVNKNKKYVFFLIDLLNINNETINTFKKIKANKTLVVSKLDNIPKSIKQTTVNSWLKSVYKIEENIIFISSKKSLNIEQIYNILAKENQNQAYILGFTNAGKSTLINKLCLDNNITDNIITTSLIPNTTLDFIKIKLNDQLTIIDSPGFTMQDNLYKDNEFELIERINPKCFLKPVTYQTKNNTSLTIENKIKIIPGNLNSLTFYMSNQIKIIKNFEKDIFLNDKAFSTYKIEENSDLVIKGIGFINIKKACTLKVYSEYQNLIEIRKSMF